MIRHLQSVSQWFLGRQPFSGEEDLYREPAVCVSLSRQSQPTPTLVEKRIFLQILSFMLCWIRKEISHPLPSRDMVWGAGTPWGGHNAGSIPPTALRYPCLSLIELASYLLCLSWAAWVSLRGEGMLCSPVSASYGGMGGFIGTTMWFGQPAVIFP